MSFVYKKCLGRAFVSDQDVCVHWFTVRTPALMVVGGSRLVGHVHTDGRIESFESRQYDIFHWPPCPLSVRMGDNRFQPAIDLVMLAEAVDSDDAEGKRQSSIYWMADHSFAIGIAFTEDDLVRVALERGFRVPDGHGYTDQWEKLERAQKPVRTDIFA